MPPELIQGVTRFGGTGAPPRPHTDVLIAEGRFAAVGPSGTLTVPSEATVTAAPGQFALPGLIDAHVHVWQGFMLPLLLDHGVTTVRDVGNTLARAQGLAAAVARGERLGPRLRYCGPLLDGPAPIWGPLLSEELTAPEQAPAVVERLHASGVCGLKLYAKLAPEVAAATIAAGHAHGLPVTAHLEQTTPAEALAAGVDGIEHATSLARALLSPAPPPSADPRQNARQEWRRWAALDLDSPVVEALAARLVAANTYLTATLIVHDPERWRSGPTRPELAWVPEKTASPWQTLAGLFATPAEADQALAQEAFAAQRALVGRLHRLGVRILAGTDTPNPYVIPGLSLHDELAHLAAAGLSPAEALAAATGGNAVALGWGDELGTIAAGRRADLVLLAPGANPLGDITQTRRIVRVWRDGVAYVPPGLVG